MTRKLKLMVGFCVAVALVRGSVADLTRVTGRSMETTLVRGDYVYLNKLAYGLSLPFLDRAFGVWAVPERGEVVVLFSPVNGRTLVKRVAGVPGDTIAEGVVPPGTVFVMGDNRDASGDSRQFGPVARDRVVGRVEHILFSLDPACYHRPRGQRWFRPVSSDQEP